MLVYTPLLVVKIFYCSTTRFNLRYDVTHNAYRALNTTSI